MPEMNPQFVPRTVLNIVARGPATPVAQALPAVENILNATVQQIMRGTGVAVPFPVHLLINTPVRVPAMPVAQALPAVENILNARVQAAMNGAGVAVRGGNVNNVIY